MSPAPEAGPTPRTRLAILFLTVFVDLVGFGIVLPLLPFYADRFGASGLGIGLLVTSYSAAQFLLAPVWGRLSDRIGRRPVLLVGLVGSGLSYVVFAFAPNLEALFLSRILAGVAGANVSVAQAYIADVTPPEDRAGGMGLIGAAFGLGFIFGPALGGILAPLGYEVPGLAAAGLCFANAGVAAFRLPESVDEEERLARRSRRTSPREALARLGGSGALWVILGMAFCVSVAFSAMQPTFPLFGAERFGFGERTVGWLFAFMGFISAVMQGLLVRKLAPRVGEARLARLGTVPFGVGLLGIAWSPSPSLLLVSLGLLAAGFGAVLPTLMSLVSQHAPEEIHGGVLGVADSVRSLGRIVGPVLAGILFDGLGIAWPYLAGAILAGVALVLSVAAVRPAPRDEPVEAGPPPTPEPAPPGTTR